MHLLEISVKSRGVVLNYIKKFIDIKDENILNYGNKAINISKLVQNNFRIPDGLVLSSAAFNDFCFDNGISITAENIQNLINEGAYHDKINENITCIWNNISSNYGKESIIIRSSAIGEDSPGHSFAGIYESILNIRSFDDMKTAIKKCWASYYSEQQIPQ